MKALFKRIRSIRFRTLLAFSLLASTIIVLSAIPGRREGVRTASFAFIPFRSLTIVEAAALLTCPAHEKFRADHYGCILKLDNKKVSIGTFAYLIDAASNNGVEALPMFHYKDRQFFPIANSWESYVTVHSVDRRKLEAELGRPITEDDISNACVEGSSISFDSDRLWLYAIAEIFFITFLLASFLLIITKLKTIWLLFPLIFLLQVIIFVFAFMYAPAMFDADWFIQRIVIERIWLTNLYLIFPGIALTGISLIGLLLSFTGKKLHNAGKVDITRYRAFITRILFISVFLCISWDYFNYRQEVSLSREVLSQIETKLDPGTIDLLKTESPENNTDKILLSEYTENNHEVAIFIHLYGNYYRFLWKNPNFDYSDFRNADNTDMMPVDREMDILKDKSAYRTSFFQYLFAPFYAANAVKDENGKIKAIISFNSEFTYQTPHTPLRFVLQLAFANI